MRLIKEWGFRVVWLRQGLWFNGGMRGIIVLGLVAVILGGCGKAAVSGEQTVNGSEKQSVLEGKLVVGSELTVINTESGPVDVESYSVDLKQYDGKKVRVEGEYSGTTMFADKVSVVE